MVAVLRFPDQIDTEDHSMFSGRNLFLGGNMNLGSWIDNFLEKIDDLDILVYDPRRVGFSSNPEAEIRWRNHYLSLAAKRLFWFANEDYYSIGMFELGRFAKSTDKLLIGCASHYRYAWHLESVMATVDPLFKISKDMDDLATQVKKWACHG